MIVKNYNNSFVIKSCLFLGLIFFSGFLHSAQVRETKAKPEQKSTDPEKVFLSPPQSAKPTVMWMWMGNSISKEGIRKDLEALKEAGFGGTTMFSLGDMSTVYAYDLLNSFQGEKIAWTEPWWELVRYAAEESKRLGLDLGLFNCPGSETSGGKWIPVEYSMQELCRSETILYGGQHVWVTLPKPEVDLHAVMLGPVHNPETGILEKPLIPERKTYYRDIAVMAVPANGIISKEKIIILSDKMTSEGKVECNFPAGEWKIYRIGHTTRGSLIYPTQWKARGFECDKMNPDAIAFHMDYIIGEAKKHLGSLVGTTFSNFHFDSYEAGVSNWTPRMKEEFQKRRGYDLTPYLLTFFNRVVIGAEETKKFNQDFDNTIKDLYKEVYFTTIQKKLHEANLKFSCEPYRGPWRPEEIMPMVDRVMTEFWTSNRPYFESWVKSTKDAALKTGQNIIESEAFSGQPQVSQWNETPYWFKSLGDIAFCDGINKFVLHRLTQQPFDDKYKPGVTMGQWGSHFDRTQTWWKPAKAMFTYWQRCQALLQWGKVVENKNDLKVLSSSEGADIKFIQRKSGETDLFFVANTALKAGEASCSFTYTGKKPELWDPVTAKIHDLSIYSIEGNKIVIPLKFEPSQSFFIVFRKPNKGAMASKSLSNFPTYSSVMDISQDWTVTFDTKWGGPENPVKFTQLTDWTKNNIKGIKYYSGTATYTKIFNYDNSISKKPLFVDLGTVNHIARIKLNGMDLGVVWCAPWRTEIPYRSLKPANNKIEIEITNVWANRLIGDEQEPDDCEWITADFGYGNFRYLKQFPEWFLKDQQRPSNGRYCFLTYNYFNKDSNLTPSGLLGPVQILRED